jgi:sulfoxide reductase heme-binding subunit YedZ
LIAAELKSPRFQKQLLYFNAALPALLLLWDWGNGNLGANPPEAVLRTTGVIAILFLVFTLAVTPLAQAFHWPWLVKHRRALGLIAFFYALTHFVAYFFFDRGASLSRVLKDVGKRPFILLGLACLLLMIPLAITSTNAFVRRMGKNWKRLHRLTYLIAPLAVIHYWMIVKSDVTYPLLFACAFALLFLYRAWKSAKKSAKKLAP